MLRFCGEKIINENQKVKVAIGEGQLILDEHIWENGKNIFRGNDYHDVVGMQMIPISNVQGEIICYGWQDLEANRELRMLEELAESQTALAFGDVFPDIREVVIVGCNELAYYFAKYLQNLGIPVSVLGKYWGNLGFNHVADVDLEDCYKMIVHAERIWGNRTDLFQKVIRSASPEFECIDRIYEANILAGNIKDNEGDFNDLLEKLEGRDIVILGRDEAAQDVYDMFCEYHIDIKGFAVENISEDKSERLLGKPIISVAALLQNEERVVFIDVHGKNSAWGNRCVELLNYYGYKRNEHLFFINDYTKIHCNNLIHVLKGKSVFLFGDERLSKILSDYLEDIEQGNIELQYAKVLRPGMVKDTDILCAIYLWHGPEASVKKVESLGEYALSMPYTDYFSRAQAFVIINHYMTKGADKYFIRDLEPKGILMNITDTSNGNVFFKGILDGHPNILLLPHNFLNDNLFVYCSYLSGEEPKNICSAFYLMLQENKNEEQIKDVFPYWSRFEESMERWLCLRESFTSQELFMIFHVAYTEMMSGEKITDLSQKVIYYDPHWVSLADRYFLVKWFASERIDAKIIKIHRDGVAWLASTYEFRLEACGEKELAGEIVECICRKSQISGHESNQAWNELEVRFEDLKLHAEDELLKICECIKIPWDNSMLQTTMFGKPSSLGMIKGFDLKPLINKHETYWSEFDRFRLCIIMGGFQKKYGYFYEDCTRFSRTELWEMFLQKFRFQSELEFESLEQEYSYYLWVYDMIRWQLYETRRYMLLDDVKPKFSALFKESKAEKRKMARKTEINNLIELIEQKEQLVLYGLGRDGEILWDCLDDMLRSRLVVCDKKAEKGKCLFHGKEVIKPRELCTKYSEYEVLVTSSRYYREIIEDLNAMGINAGRIKYNMVQLWDDNSK